MSSILGVVYEGALMGVLRRDGQSLSFSYDNDFPFSGDVPPLSQSMPINTSYHEGEVVNAFLDNLLPDNPAVRERWARDFGVSSLNPFELLKHVGHDLSGAVWFLSPTENLPEPKAELLSDADVAEHLRNLRSDESSWIDKNSGYFSLAGAQRKFALARLPDGWAKVTGRIPSTHIFKTGVEGFSDGDLNEYACLSVAQRLGLSVAKSSIAHFEDERAIVIERFDRDTENRVFAARLHQEDLCQALGFYSDHKYENDGGPSAMRIFKLLDSMPDKAAAVSAKARFVDALIFNWMIGGTDAHAKNYSLLYSGADFTLAPLYDLVSYLPYGDRIEKAKMAMAIDGEYRFGIISGRHWKRFAESSGLEPGDLIERIHEIGNSVSVHFAAIARELSEEGYGDFFRALSTSVEHHVADCLRSLSR